MEHSLQYNYWAYQTIKLYIKDQEKNKMMSDISLIANANGIGMSNQSQRAINEHEGDHSGAEDLINITYDGGRGRSSSGSY